MAWISPLWILVRRELMFAPALAGEKSVSMRTRSAVLLFGLLSEVVKVSILSWDGTCCITQLIQN